MADTDPALYILRYNQNSQKLEASGGTPEWNPLTLTNAGGGGGSPGGSDTNIQFNDSGDFAGSDFLSWRGDSHTGGLLVGTDDGIQNIIDFHGVNTPIDVVIQSKGETDVYTGITITSANSGADPAHNLYAYTEYLRCRGTLATPTAVQNGDILGETAFIGFSDGAYGVFALIDGHCTGGSSDTGMLTMHFRDAGALPGSQQLYFSPTGIGIGSAPSKPIDILDSDAATLSGRVKNSDGTGAASWIAMNDQNHSFEIGMGGSTRGDGFQDTAYLYTAGSARPVASDWSFNITGIADADTALYIDSAKNTVLGSHVSDGSGKFEIVSTTQGLLFPRMTTTQKDAIASPAEGLVVYDTTLHKLCVRAAAAWQTITSV